MRTALIAFTFASFSFSACAGTADTPIVEKATASTSVAPPRAQSKETTDASKVGDRRVEEKGPGNYVDPISGYDPANRDDKGTAAEKERVKDKERETD